MDRITHFTPSRDFLTLREAMDHLFEDAYIGGRSRRNGDTASEWRLPIDAYMTEGEIVLQASVPGLNPDQVQITLEVETLTIRGEFPAPLENVSYLFAERPWGKFSRTLQLNVPVDSDKVEADFENGLLTLTLPKAEAIRPKTIPVKVRQTA